MILLYTIYYYVLQKTLTSIYACYLRSIFFIFFIYEDFILNNKFLNAVKWSLLILTIVLLFTFIIIPGVTTMLQPTFFPKTDISGFQKTVTNSGYIVGVMSAALGFISIWQGKQNDKKNDEQIDKLLSSINEIKTNQQNFILAQRVQQPDFEKSQSKTSKWQMDTHDE